MELGRLARTRVGASSREEAIATAASAARPLSGQIVEIRLSGQREIDLLNV